MAPDESLEILDRLLAARSYSDQNLALRNIKNEVIGHIRKQEAWVELGVLRPLVDVLSLSRPGNWDDSDDNSSSTHRLAPTVIPDTLRPAVRARLQALELLGVFASGGPVFLAPLHAAGALPAILSWLQPQAAHPQIVVAVIRTLIAIAKSTKLIDSSTMLPSSPSPSPTSLTSLADAIIATPHVHGLRLLLTLQPQGVSAANATVDLIRLTCCEERHCQALADAGVLEALTDMLAAYVVARGEVVPGADVAAEREGLREHIPDPAPQNMHMAVVMEAVTAIIGDSPRRAFMLVYAPSMLAIFPQIEFATAVADNYAAWRALSMNSLCSLQQLSLSAHDLLLPAVPSLQARYHMAQSSAFPPLGVSLSKEHLMAIACHPDRADVIYAAAVATNATAIAANATAGASSATLPGSVSATNGSGSSGATKFASPAVGGSTTGPSLSADQGSQGQAAPLDPLATAASQAEGLLGETESPMVPWLIHLVRSTTGRERVAAAGVLTALYKLGMAQKTREAAMAMLVIPELTDALTTIQSDRSDNDSSGHSRRIGIVRASSFNDDSSFDTTERRIATVNTLHILARLVANSDILQKAADDCRLVQVLAGLLKEAYEPVSSRLPPRPWTPTPGDAAAAEKPGNSDPARRLGVPGQSLLLAHHIAVREGTLKALAAMLESKKVYCERFVESEDAVACLMASLCPAPSQPKSYGIGNRDRKMTKKMQSKRRASPGGRGRFGVSGGNANGGGGGGGGRNHGDNKGSSNDNDNDDDDIMDEDQTVDPDYGSNPPSVLKAACNCVRFLARSIAMLRTTLFDAGVAAPVCRLLRSSDRQVLVDAVGAMCNLVTRHSPMRDGCIEMGMIPMLCKLAHSEHPPLRLNALWALKHLVDGMKNADRQACIEQLGIGWLLQQIDSDSVEDEAAATAATAGPFTRTRSWKAAAAARESVAAPRTTRTDDEDVEMEQSGNGDSGNGEDEGMVGRRGMGVLAAAATAAAAAAAAAGPAAVAEAKTQSASGGGFPLTSHERSRTGRQRMAEAKLALLRDVELSQRRWKSWKDEKEIEEQGLNIIRNLIGPGDTPSGRPEEGEMLDYLLEAFGQQRLFQVLQKKLGISKTATAASSTDIHLSMAGAATEQMLAQQDKIAEAALYVLVHISAGEARHRQAVMASQELLRGLATLLGSRNRDVRLALCHLLTNVTWSDNKDDNAPAAQRANTMRQLGLLAKLRVVQKEDPELTVREQARMAVVHMEMQGIS